MSRVEGTELKVSHKEARKSTEHSIGGVLCFGAVFAAEVLIAFEHARVDGFVKRKLHEVDGPLQSLRFVWKLHR